MHRRQIHWADLSSPLYCETSLKRKYGPPSNINYSTLTKPISNDPEARRVLSDKIEPRLTSPLDGEMSEWSVYQPEKNLRLLNMQNKPSLENSPELDTNFELDVAVGILVPPLPQPRITDS